MPRRSNPASTGGLRDSKSGARGCFISQYGAGTVAPKQRSLGTWTKHRWQHITVNMGSGSSCSLPLGVLRAVKHAYATNQRLKWLLNYSNFTTVLHASLGVDMFTISIR